MENVIVKNDGAKSQKSLDVKLELDGVAIINVIQLRKLI
jgi:hypothetical protein